jgi:hypothetical protein
MSVTIMFGLGFGAMPAMFVVPVLWQKNGEWLMTATRRGRSATAAVLG